MNNKGIRVFILIFTIIMISLIVVNIILIVQFSKTDVESQFFDSLNVASLFIAFTSFAASAFFSFAVYMQGKAQERINNKIPDKVDQYIINNYSLINFEKELSVFTKLDENIDVVKSRNEILGQKEKDSKIYRFVFTMSEVMNKPIYKIEFSSVGIFDSKDKLINNYMSINPVDVHLAENVLTRKESLVYVDLFELNNDLTKLMKKGELKKIIIKANLISIFNVLFEVEYIVYLGDLIDSKLNPDIKKIDDMTQIQVHHTNYHVLNSRMVVLE